MGREINLTTPISTEEVRKLKVGDEVYLSGTMFTARDIGLKKMAAFLRMKKRWPFSLKDSALMYAGPLIVRGEGGFRLIANSPGTSARMPSPAAIIKNSGLRLIIGKGGMAEEAIPAMKAAGCVYLSFPGGCGALTVAQTEAIEAGYWPDLGLPDRVWKMRVRRLGPLLVTIDARGNDHYARVKRQVRRNITALSSKK